MEALTSVYNWTLGTSLVAQLIQVVIIAFLTYSLLMGGKSFLDSMNTYANSVEDLLPYLYDNTKPIQIRQDPTSGSDAITINPSVNAPSGLEFSYSCFLILNKSNFQDATGGLRHIFHKGSPEYKPLMCPGVFVRSNENTLVIYMNEASSWNTHCEIPNMPIGKWFHLAIVVRNMNVDVYINGNVVHRLTLSSVPKQNFGDIYVFNSQKKSDKGIAPPDNDFTVVGKADGFISRLQYSAFALNYEQIDRMLRAGPSTKLVSASQNLPPYLTDSWWVTYYR